MVRDSGALPIFTIELKNQISGQNISHAIKQYKDTRDPKEPLFRFKRCLAHFAVDNDLVYVTTELAGAKTRITVSWARQPRNYVAPNMRDSC